MSTRPVGHAPSPQPERTLKSTCDIIFKKPLSLWVLGLGFALLFAAYQAVHSFMTQTFKELGAYSLAVMYGFFASSTLIAPYLVHLLGASNGLGLASLGYLGFVGAAVLGQSALLIICSAILGFAAALLWTSQGAVLSEMSTPDTLGTNTGVFFALFRASVAGNYLAARLLDSGYPMAAVFTILFFMAIAGCVCLISLRCLLSKGKLQLPAIELPALRQKHGYEKVSTDPESLDQTSNSDKQAESDSGSASLQDETEVSQSSDKNSPTLNPEEKTSPKRPVATPIQSLRNTLKVVVSEPMKHLGGLMLGVIGIGKGWLYGSFPLKMGESRIGHVFTAYGIILILAGLFAGWLFDKTQGRWKRRVLMIPFIANLCSLGCSYLAVHYDSTVLFYVAASWFAVLVGFFDACISAIFGNGSLYPKEEIPAAFACKVLTEALGAVLFLVFGRYLPFDWQLLLLAGVGCIAFFLWSSWRMPQATLESGSFREQKVPLGTTESSSPASQLTPLSPKPMSSPSTSALPTKISDSDVLP